TNLLAAWELANRSTYDWQPTNQTARNNTNIANCKRRFEILVHAACPPTADQEPCMLDLSEADLRANPVLLSVESAGPARSLRHWQVQTNPFLGRYYENW